MINSKNFLAVAAVLCIGACTDLEEYPTGFGANQGVVKSQEAVPTYEGRAQDSNSGMNDGYDMDSELMNNGDLDKNFQEFQRKG